LDGTIGAIAIGQKMNVPFSYDARQAKISMRFVKSSQGQRAWNVGGRQL